MNKFWEIIDSIMYFILYKVLHIKLKEEMWEKLSQFVKFGIVGASNTLISYAVYIILVGLDMYYLVASIMGFLVSVINAYYWNNKYVFKSRGTEEERWWRKFLKTFTAYAGTGLILHNLLLVLWVEILGIAEMWGPIINLFITTPINFLLNKYWAFKKQKASVKVVK